MEIRRLGMRLDKMMAWTRVKIEVQENGRRLRDKSERSRGN